MPIPPYFYDNDMPRWARHSFDHNFGRTMRNEDIFTRYGYWPPKDEGSSMKIDSEKWQINVDVRQFSPDEVTVKTNNGFIVVEGKHEEKQDEHGYVSRHFVRRFKIPEDTNPNAIESKLSADGVLIVLAYRLEPPKGERTIPISHTGPVREEIKEEPIKY